MHPPKGRSAFTLIELLIVIAIVAVLVALLLPAVQAARESARRTQCTNNVKQLALAALHHHDALRFFPTGGWGRFWVGDADRGFGRGQTGGWLYNVLPYIEQPGFHRLPSDGNAAVVTEAQRVGAGRLVAAAIDPIRCPTRRASSIHPLTRTDLHDVARNWAPPVDRVAGRSDYAMCIGDQNVEVGGREGDPSPSKLDEEGTYGWQWDEVGVPAPAQTPGYSLPMTGVSFQRSEIAVRHVIDGVSNTYLVGEKYLDPADYETGLDLGDNDSWVAGYNVDNYRTGFNPPAMDHPTPQKVICLSNVFGGPHPAGWLTSFCDGRVVLVNFDVDVLVHRSNANRHDDGKPTTAPTTCPTGVL